MNVLEKILEEIKKEKNSYEADHAWNYSKGLEHAEEIIRSHMNNLQDADAEEKSILCTVGEDGVLTSYDDTYDVIIHCSNKEDQNRTIELIKNFNWIPVSERLPEPYKLVEVTVHCSEWISDYDSVWVPENEKIHHDEEYLARMGYMDKDGDWIFYDQDGCEFYCEKEFGSDKIDVYNVVTAWQPLPEPYKGE